MPYAIHYTQIAEKHLRALPARLQRTVIDTVDRQLMHEPTKATRNKKQMRPNPIAPWELRIGTLRVYYDVNEDEGPSVNVVAIGIKERNTVVIGGEVMELNDEND